MPGIFRDEPYPKKGVAEGNGSGAGRFNLLPCNVNWPRGQVLLTKDSIISLLNTH